MRHFVLVVVLLQVLDVLGQDACQQYCDNVSACVGIGSYCKSNLSPNVCFGLYWRDISETTMCFSPNDATCPQAIPVQCPGEVTTSTPPPPNTCQSICSLTPSCAFGVNSQGSWCKSYQSIPVCFGLYWRDPARTQSCYFPSDPTCPEGDPILCG